MGAEKEDQTERIGQVSSVNAEKRTARVFFPEMGIPSGELKVLSNQPVITVVKTENGGKWDYEAHYASAPRNLGMGESYTKATPDTIKNSRAIDYKCPLHGVDETKQHEQIIKVYPWLPFIGQTVVCLYRANGDGFVVGGIE